MGAQRLRKTKREWAEHYGVPAPCPVLLKDFDGHEAIALKRDWAGDPYFHLDEGAYFGEEPQPRTWFPPKRDTFTTPIATPPSQPKPPQARAEVRDWLSEHIKADRERLRLENERLAHQLAEASRRLSSIEETAREKATAAAVEIVADNMRYVRVRFNLGDMSTIEAQYDLDTNRGVNAWRKDASKYDWVLVGYSLCGALPAHECWA